MIVCKFGGTSLADADHIRRVASIIRANADRRVIVVSAPGKRFPEDEKITDLLLRCRRAAASKEDYSPLFDTLKCRFRAIISGLGTDCSLDDDFNELRDRLDRGASEAYAASRGEYFNAKIIASYLGFSFVDAADVIAFGRDGQPENDRSVFRLAGALKERTHAVIPGFYGSDPDGEICTFSRGGSDVTGSLAAAAAGAEVYENWTDVSGLKMADPRIVPDAKSIPVVTYRELRELSYMGATVVHEDAVFPVRTRHIPIRILNTLAPDDPGTLIVPEADAVPGTVTGIAGKKGFSALFLEKDRMNAEIGFGRKVLSVLEDAGVSFEHLPSGIDTLSVLMDSQALNGNEDRILEAIQTAVQPDRMHIEQNLALIAVVGRGLIRSPGSAARLFNALAKANINVRMIDQGSSELNMIVAVEEKDYEKAVESVYREFVPPMPY